MANKQKRGLSGEQIGLIFSGIITLFLFFMPFLLKSVPDFVSGNTTAQLVRENVNMTVAYILLALIPFVIAGWIWAFKRAGKKPDIDLLEERINKRFDAIDRKLGIGEEITKGDKKNGKDDKNQTDRPKSWL